MNINLLETSFDMVRPQASAFSTSFYQTLFQHHPELEPMFASISQSAQEKKLIFSLAAIVDNLRNPEVLEPALKSLGARHFQVGTLAEHYPFVGQALLETFASYLGAAWTSEMAAAWSDAYEGIATTMLEGAKAPEVYLEPELTFYDWIDLYGEENPRIKEAFATLTEFHYGSRPEPEAIRQA